MPRLTMATPPVAVADLRRAKPATKRLDPLSIAEVAQGPRLGVEGNNYTYQTWESLRAGARERQVSLTLQWITSWNDKTVVLT